MQFKHHTTAKSQYNRGCDKVVKNSETINNHLTVLLTVVL